MSDRFPLIVNTSTGKIEELAFGDSLNLDGNSIVGASTITASQFYGSLTGTATTSNYLLNAANIVSGIVSTSRLSGTYPISISGSSALSNSLSDAGNILDGIIDPARLFGTYNISIEGNASSADTLNNAANITSGFISPNRLTGTYNINVTGVSAISDFSNFSSSSGTATTSLYLSNAANINAGTISSARLSGNYDISISGSSQFSSISNYSNTAGIASYTNYSDFSGISTNVDGDYVSTVDLNVSGISTLNTTTTDSLTSNTITSGLYYGSGAALVGIVTQITTGVGLTLTSSQPGGKGVVDIRGRTDLIGKTIFVAQNGNDLNSGLVETDPKRTIKAAISIAVPGDTVRVYPGSYIEDNPIVMPKNTSIYGSELRNCLVTPANPGLDLFLTNDGCHIVNVSFVGQPSENQAAIVAFKPLLGVATDRFFDATRMIRQNLDFISRESVGFLTSGYSGYAGTHREQDAGKLLYKNLDFIAAEAVGYITSTDYKNPVFVISDSNGQPVNISNCTDDVKDVIASVAKDLFASGNYYSVGAALSYFTNGVLSHINGISTSGHSISEATVAALSRAAGIATFVINNYPWGSVATGDPKNITNFVYDNTTGLSTITAAGHGVDVGDIVKLSGIKFTCPGGSGISTDIFPDGSIGNFFTVTKKISSARFEIIAGVSTIAHSHDSGGVLEKYNNYQSSIKQTIDKSVIHVPFGCVGIANTIMNLVGIITSAIGSGSTSSLPTRVRGVDLDTNTCARDVKLLWKAICHDITRGGNSKCVGAAKSYFNDDGTLKSGLLRNSLEQEQTVKVLDYSFNVARSVINNCTWGSVIDGSPKNVSNAIYDNTTGLTTITVSNHNLTKGDSVHISGLGFTCPSGPSILNYPSGKYGYVFEVKNAPNSNTFEVLVGASTLPHTYLSGGVIKKYKNFQNQYTQVKDLSIQPDPITGYNNSIDSCANVISAVHSCVGILTTIIGIGLSALSGTSNPSGIKTTYPGNFGLGITSTASISNAVYDHKTGNTILTIPNYTIKKGDRIEIRDLNFSCDSGGGISTQKFPSGRYGYEFYVDRILENGSIVVNTGVSTIPHDYVGGGFVVDRSFGITTASYNNITGITTITAPGAHFRIGDIVNVQDLIFSCNSGGGPSTAIYPSGNLGYDFKVIGIGTTTSQCIINTGVSTIAHTYISDGVIRPPYSSGVGNINKGPYIRNCTNFVPNSIGMKVDGFDAEPGDEDDNGVTGAMSVDSYTQYNQGGIGVSITNGAYCQLVSIFTICDDIAIYTSGGGQCDINNSNASFGNYGLYSEGVGDNKSKSIYRYTGNALTTSPAETDVITISGVGNNRPYDGQAIYFGELYYELGEISVINGGSGYTSPPKVVIDSPTGPNGIKAEAIASIENGSVVSVDLISSGNQFLLKPNITFVGGGGSGAAATVSYLDPIYYNVETATLPNAGISTVTLTRKLNNTVGAGTTVYFSRLSLEIATTISLEWVGAGTNITTAKPGLGGVTIQGNEVVMKDGGRVVYTSTNQAGDFRIGEDFVINQLTGTITGRAFSQSLLNTVTPLIIALGR